MSAPATPPGLDHHDHHDHHDHDVTTNGVQPVPSPDTLTITVLDTATIFEGPDTVYRYDLPGTGVTEGWALAAVIDQARELCSLHWPEVEVIIDADDPTTDLLTRTLLNKGVAAYPTEALRETALPEVPGEDGDGDGDTGEVEITRPTVSGRHRFRGRAGDSWWGRIGLHPFHLVIVAVILLVGAVSWWTIDTQTGSVLHDPAREPEALIAAATDDDGNAAGAGDGDRDGGSGSGEKSAPETPPEVILEHSGLRVTAPVGFSVDNRDDALLATGDDPDLRIHLAADPVHNVPPGAVHQEVEKMVTADPTLDGLHPDETSGRGDEVLVYQEAPGDGSKVSWSTWVAAGHQFSVGCHTRTEPTLPQRAACRMAVESLSLTG